MILEKFAKKTLLLPRLIKRAIALLADISICILSVWFSYYLRLGELLPIKESLSYDLVTPIIVSLGLGIPIFIAFGFYRAIFRYSGRETLKNFIYSGFLYGLIYVSIFTIVGIAGVPRTIGIIQPILLFLGVGISRIFISNWLGASYKKIIKKQVVTKVFIYGVGSSGRQLALEFKSDPNIKILGFIDDDRQFWGGIIDGFKVYSPEIIGELKNKFDADEIYLALTSATRQRRNEIIAAILPTMVKVSSLPSLAQLASGQVQISDIQELDIEDLLGREAVTLRSNLTFEHIYQKIILVTGAGGSIGGEICRKIITRAPNILLLLDQSEFALYKIQQELINLLRLQNNKKIQVVTLLASVQDEARMVKIIQTWGPSIIYHAAAYKHVSIVQHNPIEGLSNNVFGTLALAISAARLGVENFILISTDKAVRPTNIMGASKRLAEMILQALARNSLNHKTIFSMVRFGNVLGSSGSVVPKFRDQIKKGGPITLTDLEVTRFFMTIPEAADLVIEASAMAKGGEVFLLDMGQPVRIFDLAKRMIELSGLSLRDLENPNGDISIKVTGLLPGEKLYEELLIGNNPQKTNHPRIMKSDEKLVPWSVLEDKLLLLKTAMQNLDHLQINMLLSDLVEGYKSHDQIVDLVYLQENQL